MSEEPKKDLYIEPKAVWLPLTVYIGIAAVLMTGVWHAARLATVVERNTEAVQELYEKLDGGWQLQDMHRWVNQLKIIYPTIPWPDPSTVR